MIISHSFNVVGLLTFSPSTVLAQATEPDLRNSFLEDPPVSERVRPQRRARVGSRQQIYRQSGSPAETLRTELNPLEEFPITGFRFFHVPECRVRDVPRLKRRPANGRRPFSRE